jgi:hypothetical protein
MLVVAVERLAVQIPQVIVQRANRRLLLVHDASESGTERTVCHRNQMALYAETVVAADDLPNNPLWV